MQGLFRGVNKFDWLTFTSFRTKSAELTVHNYGFRFAFLN